MINLQGIRTRSFAPFESKGIFTKKKKKHRLSESKTLDKNFHTQMKNIFENFLLITQRVKKKKKKLQSDRLNLNEYNSRGILLKILEKNFIKRNSHLRYNTFPSDYDQGKQLKRYTRSTIHGDRCPTLIGRHGSDRVQFTQADKRSVFVIVERIFLLVLIGFDKPDKVSGLTAVRR